MSRYERLKAAMARPLGPGATAALAVVILLAPAYLFLDALTTYRLHSDDFEYLARSRTFRKAWSNLFVPHNTHIVPAWRLLTWGVMRASGRLASLPTTLAFASYGALVLAMLLTGRIAVRESGRSAVGLLAMVLLGTTSVMRSSATWYSSGQTLWAAIGVLATLMTLQGWRRSGGAWRLILAGGFAAISGWFWTIGYAAGPVGSAYLLADGRKRSRWAALVPLASALAAAGLALTIGGRQIDATISFHGRTETEAVDFRSGLSHSLQAIPEELVFQNLGLEAETSPWQGAALTGLIAFAWAAWLVQRRRGPNPLELAGAVLVGSAYLVEWSFRGYLPFSSLRGVVPWYATIPHVGAVLFVVGLFGRGSESAPEPLRRGPALALIALLVGLLALHTPRVEALHFRGIPPRALEPIEPRLDSPELRHAAARALAAEFARRQRLDLAHLDRAEEVARRLDIGHEAIEAAFGRVTVLEIPDVYDANGLLAVRDRGATSEPVRVREALGQYLRPSEPPVLGIDPDRGGFRFDR